MTTEDPIAPLIPWYAAGTLDPAESAQVEAHLAACDRCRDLLALARGFRRLAPQVPRETLFDHIQSQLLVEFATDPAALEPDARRYITTHIQACAPCAEALEILEDLERGPVADEAGSAREAAARPVQGGLRQAWMGIWSPLSRTVLHPVPALAYLTALVILLVAVPLRMPGPGVNAPPSPIPDSQPPPSGPPERPTVTVVPPAFDLPGEVQFRGEDRPSPPASVPVPAGATSVTLSLVTDLDREDLEDATATFRVEIMQGDRLLLEARRHPADFDRRGRLLLLLDSEAIAKGVPCRVSLFLEKPGDPRDGEMLFRRSFVLVEDATLPR